MKKNISITILMVFLCTGLSYNTSNTANAEKWAKYYREYTCWNQLNGNCVKQGEVLPSPEELIGNPKYDIPYKVRAKKCKTVYKKNLPKAMKHNFYTANIRKAGITKKQLKSVIKIDLKTDYKECVMRQKYIHDDELYYRNKKLYNQLTIEQHNKLISSSYKLGNLAILLLDKKEVEIHEWKTKKLAKLFKIPYKKNKYVKKVPYSSYMHRKFVSFSAPKNGQILTKKEKKKINKILKNYKKHLLFHEKNLVKNLIQK
jgi:hypothetical protein